MNADKAERMMALFAEAEDIPPDQHAAFLARACPDDAELRQEVAALLRCQGETDGFLEEPAFSHGLQMLQRAAAGELHAGDVVGECRVVSLLGVGGMGEVYLAEDTVHRRSVALKLIGQGRAEDVRGRHFRHERKVLASLNHPYIARLYGSGVTTQGQAYLVMEYVAGERLDRYCQNHGLDIRARLSLFRKVCTAVSYAHQNLVVHRDLKPANIRVTPEGEPKLLDFGIAKLLDPEGTTARLDPTVTMQGAMTPEYASPEQIKGEPITTASDVYSLGVLLFELLTGQRPFAHLQSRRPDELARAICEEEPPRLSTVTGRTAQAAAAAIPTTTPTLATHQRPATLRRQLEGDLDNIVAKALRKEPARRYASVAAFSEDLRRHGEGLPVSARQDTLGYRTGKFVRRNKVAVAAAVLVLATLVAGLVTTTLEARRADRRFEDVRRLAHSILFEVEPRIANVPGTMPTRRILVQRALEYLDSLAQEAGSRRDLRRELAAAYEKVGAVQGEPTQPNLGDLPGALSSYHKARALREALAAADSRDPQARYELAMCDEHLGEILWWTNQTAAGEESLRTALTACRRLVGDQPHSVAFRLGLASVLTRIGDVPAWNCKSTEAMAFYQQALPILQALARERPQDTMVRLDLTGCLKDIAKVQTDAGDYPGAMKNLVAAESIVTPIVLGEPNSYTARNLLRDALYTEVETLLVQRETSQALDLCPRLLGIAESLAKSDPDNAGSQHNLSNTYDAYARALMQAQRWPEALEAFQSALSIDTRLVKNSPAASEYVYTCGTYRANMARIRFDLGQFAQAESDAQAAQNLLEAAANQDPDYMVPRQDLIPVYELRGDLCEQRAQPAQARQWFQRALQELRARMPANLPSNDPDGWIARREKLTAKTTAKVVPAPSP